MARQPTQQEIDEQEWENPASWRWGLFYYSERDSRPWVPKRSMFGRRRFGGTPNFAKPAARAYFMLMVGVAALIVLVLIATGRMGAR
jgi:uncharacterized membrane protein